jgi:hypothetical protein
LPHTCGTQKIPGRLSKWQITKAGYEHLERNLSFINSIIKIPASGTPYSSFHGYNHECHPKVFYIQISSSSFFFFDGNVVLTQASHLLGRHSTLELCHEPFLHFFSDIVFLYAQSRLVWTMTLLFVALLGSCDDGNMALHWLRWGSHKIFCGLKQPSSRSLPSEQLGLQTWPNFIILDTIDVLLIVQAYVVMCIRTGIVRHWCFTTIILTTWKTEIGRIWHKASPREKSSWNPISKEKMPSVIEHPCIPATVGSINRRITVQPSLGKKPTSTTILFLIIKDL